MAGEVRSIQSLVVEVATQGDAAWFDKHPDRRLRIRQAVATEFNEDVGSAPVGMQWFALVLEAQPGARIRQPVALSIGFDIEGLDDGALFSLFHQAAPHGAKKIIAQLRSAKLPGTAK